jgi:cobalt-zinc-cadmium efflux system outer membrane protein
MRILVMCFTILILCKSVEAQDKPDTLKLSFPEAEKIFLQNNLSLLAAKYNIDVNKALIQQAKLWDNPVLLTDQNIYDGNFFRHNSDYGQVFIQVQQLIKTAGKRSKLAQLATDNTDIAREQFEEVLRTLRFTLRNDMIESWHLLKLSAVYTEEIGEMEKLVKGMEEVYRIGNISLKDNLRLKAVLFSLQNDQSVIQSQLIPIQAELKTLLNSTDKTYLEPVFSYQVSDLIKSELPPLDSLIQNAINTRPDERSASKSLELQQHNLDYQRALAKPDFMIGPEYDQRNSYVPNYVGLTISLPLNIYNKNQGNIKSASSSINAQKTQLELQTKQISNEVTASFNKVKYYQGLHNQGQIDLADEYDKLFQNMLKSYVDRRINLLEFTDFLDSYKDIRLKLVEQHINLVKSISELNYVTNSNIVTVQ